MPGRELLTIRNANLIWRNFAGAADQYNALGNRYFHVRFEHEADVEDLLRDGWNIRLREDAVTGEQYYTLEVTVKFGDYPPTIIKVGALTHRETQLFADTVEMLDNLRLEKVDLEISPYDWTVQGNHGRKAYLKTLWAVVQESPLELEWREALANRKPGEPIFGD